MDSPYTVKEGQSRDCLNVVSTERGAIRKRFGALQVGTVSFPSLGITDTFEQGAEKPLSNGGKWTAETFGEAENSGERTAGKFWQPTPVSLSGAFWNVKEETNPAASVEVINSLPPLRFGITTCVKGTGKEGYEARFTKEAAFNRFEVQIVRKEAIPKTLLTIKTVELSASNSIGITVRGNKVTAWVFRSGWRPIGTVEDATYTSGFSGINALGEEGGLKGAQYRNFSVGETGALTALLESELVSLASVSIAGTTYLLANAGTKLLSMNAGGEVSEIGKGFTEGKRWTVVQGPKATVEGSPLQKVGGPVYLSNGTDPPVYWTGAAKNTQVEEWKGKSGEYEDGQSTAKVKGYEVGVTTEVKAGENKTVAEFKANVPRGKFMVEQLGVIFMAGYAEDEFAVRWCGQAKLGIGGAEPDPTSWPQENIIRFDPEDGKPITGLGTVGPYVLVFKAHKIWIIHALTVTGYRRLSDKVGTIAYRSIVETEQGTYFLTPDAGVWLTNGSTVKELSYNIRPTLAAKVNGEKLEFAAGGYLNNHYYVSFPKEGQEKNSHTADYDVVLKSWWLHDLAVNQWVQWELAEEAKLYIVRPKAKDGILKAFTPGIYQDAGVNYTGDGKLGAYWRSHWETFAYYIFRHRVKAPFLKKRLRMIFFDGTGSVIPVHYKNFAASGEELAAVVTNASEAAPTKPVALGATEAKTARAYALGTINTVSLAFGNNSSEPFEIISYAWMISFRKS